LVILLKTLRLSSIAIRAEGAAVVVEAEVGAAEATMTMTEAGVADAEEEHFLGLRSLPINSGAPSSRWMIFKLEP
jgi:hypothetical protein